MTGQVEYNALLFSRVECGYPVFQCRAVLVQWLQSQTGKVPAELVPVILMRKCDRPVDTGLLSGQLLQGKKMSDGCLVTQQHHALPRRRLMMGRSNTHVLNGISHFQSPYPPAAMAFMPGIDQQCAGPCLRIPARRAIIAVSH